MRLSHKTYSLLFKHPFGVSSNTRKSTDSVFIKISDGTNEGYGEACLPAYLGETVQETEAFFEKAAFYLESVATAKAMEDILTLVDGMSTGCNAAKAAIDMALNDLLAKSAGKSWRKMMMFPECAPMATSFTIGIDNKQKLEEKIREAGDFSILKIKAGTRNDKELIEMIREFTDKPLYVDVNQGWTDKEFVIEMINWLSTKNVMLVEQPMPKHMKKEMAWVTARSPIPTIADESVKRLSDLEALENSFSGINIKLMKCAGPTEAIKMIDYAKKNNIKILLGCMAESSCGVTAMAQLMHLADYLDLDSPLLYKNDPFVGVTYEKGNIKLNDRPGLGMRPLEGFW